ncbi:restriction endonuclease [Dyadobacter luteus]|jgi:restriction system protein|uniref:Restriction endonuclease n=1 Tax=Dyadobacter luteus TaxID=2259619 RepID=A0A3D8YGN9_9BACT|nr:restriction endonuclease [Dyadobacter luteus]REA63724.1 restriction endonuclease [Dyadobacter luteus]
MAIQSKNKYHKIYEYDEYTTRGGTIYYVQIEHIGLKTHRLLRDKDDSILRKKAISQLVKWDEIWEKNEARRVKQEEKSNNQASADELNRIARLALNQVENILIHTLSINDAINWNDLKDRERFVKPNPMDSYLKEVSKLSIPVRPTYSSQPPEPLKSKFEPEFTFWDKLFSSSRQKKVDTSNKIYQTEIENWKSSCASIITANENKLRFYNEEVKRLNKQEENLKIEFQNLEKRWKEEKKVFLDQQSSYNEKIELLKNAYLNSDPEAIVQYSEMVLNNSVYPDTFPKDFELDYNSTSKMMVLDYTLPAPNDLPKLLEVKFIASRNELKESYISETQSAKQYDTSIYNISLRTVHELFEADTINGIDVIVFNGWVEVINKATGKKVNSCIVSLQVKKSEFMEIDLAHVDPKTCFKNLKGVGSSKLSGITAIQPLITINKHDKRFVSSYEVTSTLTEGYNLASMGWEDFEHLLRELFEKEFSSNGGEVKVTRASRDGGVDGIAFDPDPIRGGKIVIQAKRYTNTVGVSAVRDLYGTVVNEGATKGILVTTADYGPDAYEFAKNKPITLLNGNHLLFLLEKHGHKARIDLAEAKREQLAKK